MTEELGGVPKAPEMDDVGQYSTHEYYQEFGSWNEALDVAGLDRRESLLTEIERVASDLGEIPSTTQIDDHSRYSSSMYSKEFGSITEAREAANFSDIEDEEQNSKKFRFSEESNNHANDNDDPDQDTGSSREALLEEIKRLDTEENLVPYASDMDSDGIFKSYDCQQEFGSWDDALEAAGIDKRARLLKELQRVRDELGRIPKTEEMNRYGRVSASMYGSFFGTWSEATSLIESQDQQRTGVDGTSCSSPECKNETDSQSVLSGDNDDVITWEEIPDNSRLPALIAVQVKEEKRAHSDSVDGCYIVADLNGKEFKFKVWQKHEIDIDWEADTWYILDETRGTVWESNGELKRLLDSTRDLTVTVCGPRHPIVEDLP